MTFRARSVARFVVTHRLLVGAIDVCEGTQPFAVFHVDRTARAIVARFVATKDNPNSAFPDRATSVAVVAESSRAINVVRELTGLATFGANRPIASVMNVIYCVGAIVRFIYLRSTRLIVDIFRGRSKEVIVMLITRSYRT